MRWLVAVLLACLAFSDASAQVKCKLVVIPPATNLSKETFERNKGYLIGAMKQLGWTVSEVGVHTVKTEWIRESLYPVGPNSTNTERSGVEQYDVTWVYGWRVGNPITPIWGSGGANVDSLTLIGRWPLRPVVFHSTNGLTSVSMFTSIAACSTGITTNYAGGWPANQQPELMTAFIPGTDIEFYTSGTAISQKLDYANNTAVHGAGAGRTGYLRNLIAQHWNGLSGNVYNNCGDCDGPVATTNIETPDSTIAWERGRSSIEPAPIAFLMNAMNNSQSDVRMNHAIAAHIDSVIRVRWGDKGLPVGWEPAKMALVIDRIGFASGNLGSGNAWEGQGITCYPADCETTTFKAAFIDSLGGLASKRGAKLSLFASDSVPTFYPNVANWIDAMPSGTWKIAPQAFGGVYTSAGSQAGNATTMPQDIFGHTRSNRTWWTGPGEPPYTCAPNDTSIYCQLARDYGAFESRWRGKVMGALDPVESDHLPQGYTRSNMVHPDTLVKTLAAVGIRVVIVNPEPRSSQPAATFVVSAGNVLQVEDLNKLGFGPDDGRTYTTVKPNGDFVGQVRLAALRGPQYEVLAARAFVHIHEQEFAQGQYMAQWYMQNLPTYYHVFGTKLSVLQIPAGHFQNSTGLQQGGWWISKHAINEVAMVNRFAGREMLKIVFADEL